MKFVRPSLFAFMGWNTQGDIGPWTCYTKRGKKTVVFLKAPPTCPPTVHQISRRDHFRIVAQYWKGLTDDRRSNWEEATQVLHLNLTGYNLFTWYHTGGDRATMATIERLSKLTLVDD